MSLDFKLVSKTLHVTTKMVVHYWSETQIMLQILLFRVVSHWHIETCRFYPSFQPSLMKIMLPLVGKVMIRRTMCQHHESLKQTKTMMEGVHTNFCRQNTCVIYSKEMFYFNFWNIWKKNECYIRDAITLNTYDFSNEILVWFLSCAHLSLK